MEMKSLLSIAASFALAVLATGCAATPNQAVSTPDPSAFASWYTEITAQHLSPDSPVTGDLTSTWTGADGNPIQVVVSAPKPTSGTTVTLSAISGDNAPAITAALATLGKAGGGTLILNAGVYSLGSSTSTSPFLAISGLHDITISGPGATLLFMAWQTGIKISNSQRIRFAGLTFRYANPAIITGTIQKYGSGLSVALNPAQLQTTGALTIYQVTTLNSTGPGYAITGNRLLLGTTGASFTALGSGIYTNTQLTGFNVGDKVAVKLTYYGGSSATVTDTAGITASSDIIFDTVTVANGPGFGLSESRMGRGFAVVNSQLKPITAADGTTSIAYDGIHLSGLTGDVLIQNNQISGQGDDGINLASSISIVTQQDATGAYHISAAGNIVTGEKIALFDANLNYLGNGTEVSRLATNPVDGTSAVTLSGTIPNGSSAAFAREEAILGSRYAVIGNTISNCDCHGVLAQLPNGLVSGNTFSGLRYNAIRLLTSAAFLEGTGAANVLVTNNTISNTGADSQTGFVWSAISAYGVLASTSGALGMTPLPVNGTLSITGNTVQNTQDACITVGDTETATVQGNTCTFVSQGGQPNTGITFVPYSGSTTLRSEGIWIDPQTTTNIAVAQ
jgi:hypothetical protein